MIEATKVIVDFKQVTEHIDYQTGEAFISNRHWIIARYCEQSAETTTFYGANHEEVAQFPTINISRIRYPEADPNAVKYRALGNKAFVKSVKEEKKNAYTQWTEQEDDQLFEEVSKGYSLELMANLHDRPIGGIYSRLWKLGLEVGYDHPHLEERQKDRAKRIHKALYPAQDVGAKDVITCCGCGLTVWGKECKCWKVSSGLGNWDQKEIMNNVYMSEAFTIQEVAKMCGVKPVTVRAWISRREIASTKVNNRRYISERQITDFYRNRGNDDYVDHTYAPRKHSLDGQMQLVSI